MLPLPDTSKLEKLNRELEKSEKKLRKAINAVSYTHLDVYKRQAYDRYNPQHHTAYDRHHSRAGGLHRGGRAFILRQMPERCV